MQKIKVLNLYAGIGGNRKLWDNVEVTAVEIMPKIAKIYQDFFPNDKVVVGDAHQFLLEYFKEFDFIWSSPPCPSHSKFRFMTTKMTKEGQKRPIIYPDMSLYQEIILLTHYFKGKWIVENVKGYYEPLIRPQSCGRHYFWTNFRISPIKIDNRNFIKAHNSELSKLHGVDLSEYGEFKGTAEERKDAILRNMVNPKLGQHLFNMAFRDKQKTLELHNNGRNM